MTTATTRPIPEQYLQVVDGRTLAHRGALVHLTGRSKQTVDRYASSDSDFPVPVVARGPQRRAWYEPADLVDYAASVEHHEAGVDPELASEPSDPLLEPAEAAELMRVKLGTFNRYVAMSTEAWKRGENATLLPLPDEDEPMFAGGKRRRRRWKKSRIIAHQEQRPGRGVGGGRPARQDATTA